MVKEVSDANMRNLESKRNEQDKYYKSMMEANQKQTMAMATAGQILLNPGSISSSASAELATQQLTQGTANLVAGTPSMGTQPTSINQQFGQQPLMYSGQQYNQQSIFNQQPMTARN
jgi:hypothetical protein